MKTDRIHALFIIGSDTLPKEVLREILHSINLRYGGCTLTRGEGCWSEEGAEFSEVYDKIKTETAYQIEVSTTLEAFDSDYLKGCFRPAAPYTTWIHFELWETKAAHFNVGE